MWRSAYEHPQDLPEGQALNDHLLYVEAHIWSDEVVEEYRTKWKQRKRLGP